VAGGYFNILQERSLLGYYSPKGFFDLSTKLLVSKSMEKNKPYLDRVLQFREPFDPGVWYTLFLLVIATGLIYFLAERDINMSEFQHGCSFRSLADSVLKSFLLLTAGGGFQPITWPGRIILASWSWTILLVIAAYTANLASFLVSENTGQISYTSLEDAMNKKALICFEPGLTKRWYLKTHSSYTRFKTVDVGESWISDATFEEVFLAVRNGDCDVGLVSAHAWSLAKDSEFLNPGQRLYLAAKPLYPQFGGWYTKMRYSGRCSALVHNVLQHHFLGMELNGTLDSIVQDYYIKKSRSSTEGQEAKKEEEEQDGNERLDLPSMSGIFTIHAAGLIIAFLVYQVLELPKHWRCIKRCFASSKPDVIVPCPADCGYYVTWHPTHCCGACLHTPGMHGPKCDREKRPDASRSFTASEAIKTQSLGNLFCETSQVPAPLQQFLLGMARRLEEVQEKQTEAQAQQSEKLEQIQAKVDRVGNFAVASNVPASETVPGGNLTTMRQFIVE